MTAERVHRLEGLEPDNLLAFLALLGLLRALKEADVTLHPRASWTIDEPPLRPMLHLSQPLSIQKVSEKIASGIDTLALSHEFGDRKDLNHERAESRALLQEAALKASVSAQARANLLSALMSDVALKEGQDQVIDPTPLCTLFGQGHQHFLQRLTQVPKLAAPPPRGRGKAAVQVSAWQCIEEALFHPWHRSDPTPSFRWDPNEDVRYAMMAGDPTDSAYKAGTQHGANRLAAVGLAVLTLVPVSRARRIRPSIIGGMHNSGGFSFAWPIWKGPATLAAIVAMLAHPGLRKNDALRHLGVEGVMVSRRISVGKFMNFTRGRTLP